MPDPTTPDLTIQRASLDLREARWTMWLDFPATLPAGKDGWTGDLFAALLAQGVIFTREQVAAATSDDDVKPQVSQANVLGISHRAAERGLLRALTVLLSDRDALARVLRTQGVEHPGAYSCPTCDWSVARDVGVEHLVCPCCDTYARTLADTIVTHLLGQEAR